MATEHYLNPDGTLRIEEWMSPTGRLAEADVPMYGTAAMARALVSNGQLGLDLIRVAAGESFEPHTHPGDHLLIIVGGTGTITYDGSIYETHVGEVYLIAGDVPHAVGAITDHSILAVGSPHRPPGGADRMVLTEYDAIAADLGEIDCLICGERGTAGTLRAGGCVHAPLHRARPEPVSENPQPGEVHVVRGGLIGRAHATANGVLVVERPTHLDEAAAKSVDELALTMAQAGPIGGGEVWLPRDADLVNEALERILK